MSDTPNTENRSLIYHIDIEPHNSLPISGGDPATIIDCLKTMGTCHIQIKTSGVPALYDFSPACCYFSWQVILETTQTNEIIEKKIHPISHYFSCTIKEIEYSNAPLPPLRPKKLGAIQIRNYSRVPRELDEELKKIQQIRKGILSGSTDDIPIDTSAHKKKKRRLKTNPEKIRSSLSKIRKNSEADIDHLVETVGRLEKLHRQLRAAASENDEISLNALVSESDRLLSELKHQAMQIRENHAAKDVNRLKSKKDIPPYEIWKIVTDSKS